MSPIDYNGFQNFPFVSCLFSLFSFPSLDTHLTPPLAGLPWTRKHSRFQFGIWLRPLRCERRVKGAAGPAASPCCTPPLHKMFQVRLVIKLKVCFISVLMCVIYDVEISWHLFVHLASPVPVQKLPTSHRYCWKNIMSWIHSFIKKTFLVF